jgi:hypothetical protein
MRYFAADYKDLTRFDAVEDGAAQELK